MSIDKLTIEVHSTYLKVPASKDGVLFPRCHGLDICKVLNKLKIFNYNQAGKLISINKFYGYDEKDTSFILPRYVLSTLLNKFKEYKEEYPDFQYEILNIPPVKTKTIAMQMKSEWHDREEHKAALEHLNKENESMLANNLQTGKGKTYVAIKTSTIKAHPTLIICDSLCEQWKDNLLEKTTVKEDEIFIAQGASSVVKLITQRKILKGKLKFIIFSLPTLRLYIERSGNPYTELIPYNEFLSYYKIGVKIVDEFHLNFQSIVNIDLVSDVESNIYLSATPQRSNRQEKAVYSIIFPKSIIGGQNEYDKYVNVYVIFYDLEAWHNGDKGLMTSFGYNHKRYEQRICHDYRAYNEYIRILKSQIRQYYLDTQSKGGNGKLLILVGTVMLATKLKVDLAKYMPNHDVRTYLSADSIENLSEADVIIGTTKSTGVGKDISMLATVINTVSVASEPLLTQMLGRLRKIPNLLTRYVDLVNQNVPSQIRHAKMKRLVYAPRAAKYIEHHI